MESQKNNQEIRCCKDCHKPLPEDYKYKYCEACRNKKVETAKHVIMGVFGVGATIGAGIMLVLKGRSSESNNGSNDSDIDGDSDINDI